MLLVVCYSVMGKPADVGLRGFDIGGRPNQEMIGQQPLRQRVPEQNYERLLPSFKLEEQIESLGKPERRFSQKTGGQLNPGRLESFDKGEPTKPKGPLISHLMRTRSDHLPTEYKSGQWLEELDRTLDEPWKQTKPQQATPYSMERPTSEAMPRTKRSFRPRLNNYYNNYGGYPRYGSHYGRPYNDWYDDYDYDVIDIDISGYGF